MDTVETIKDESVLGSAAIGNIDPASRELDGEKVAALEHDVLSGRFDVEVPEGVIMPCGCIDGRCFHNGLPNASGGTLSLLVGEVLTTESNVAKSATNSEEALASLLEFLKSEGYGAQIGGHTGPDHGNEAASGCGANDNLAGIMRQLVEKPEYVYKTMQKLGVAIDAESFGGIIAKAAGLLEREDYFVAGKTVAKTLEESSPEGNCPRLEGSHNEVLIRINTVEGTTLDRRAIQEVYGDDYQVFNVDVWALKKSAETLSYSTQEANEKFAAMVAYQIATALQLCGPSMRVVVR